MVRAAPEEPVNPVVPETSAERAVQGEQANLADPEALVERVAPEESTNLADLETLVALEEQVNLAVQEMLEERATRVRDQANCQQILHVQVAAVVEAVPTGPHKARQTVLPAMRLAAMEGETARGRRAVVVNPAASLHPVAVAALPGLPVVEVVAVEAALVDVAEVEEDVNLERIRK